MNSTVIIIFQCFTKHWSYIAIIAKVIHGKFENSSDNDINAKRNNVSIILYKRAENITNYNNKFNQMLELDGYLVIIGL